MSVWAALVLGLVQGLAEFLPVSSSGHLKLAEHFLGIHLGGDAVAFEVLLHVATLGAMIVYFRDDLRRVLASFVGSFKTTLRRGGWRGLDRHPDAKWAWLVILTMIPTAAAALLFEDTLEAISENIRVVAALLLATGWLNWYADQRTQRAGQGRRIESLGAGDALFCGLAQSVALLHGISRSGSTIAAGLSRGLDRDAAPRFAFLMAIPAIAGAALVKLPKLGDGTQVGLMAAVIGFLVAGLSGYWALHTVFQVVKRGRLRNFAYYCWIVGVLALLAA